MMTLVERVLPMGQTKFNTIMLKSHLCNYSNAYRLLEGLSTGVDTLATAATAVNSSKKEIFTAIFNCSITDCMSKVNNTQRHCCSNANVLSNRVQ